VLKSSRPSYAGSITAAKKTDDREADLISLRTESRPGRNWAAVSSRLLLGVSSDDAQPLHPQVVLPAGSTFAESGEPAGAGLVGGVEVPADLAATLGRVPCPARWCPRYPKNVVYNL